jgi:hypothetical protein
MLEGELTAKLGDEKYEAKGRNSGNSRNGRYKRKVRSSGGEVEVAVPRDRNGDFEPSLLHKYETSSNELEDKIVTLYAKGLSVRDIQDSLQEMYGVAVSAGTISTITEKIWPMVEAWQNRPLEKVYPSSIGIVFMFICGAKGELKARQSIWFWRLTCKGARMYWGPGWEMGQKEPHSGQMCWANCRRAG